MVGNKAEVHVKLTEAGVYKYRHQTHLHPPLTSKQYDIYVFQCTTAQAEFYFFRFVKDAEILLQTNLKMKLARIYEETAKAYTASKHVESEGLC